MDGDYTNPNLFIVELVPQMLVLCRVCAEEKLPMDHFRQMQHPIEGKLLRDHRATIQC